ncbi:PCI domain-containing protein [Pyronema omphalodes]|nr:PCI domain-containing protein [Pyronema omphalodes]
MAETGAEREVLKAEKDYTEELDKELPQIISIAKNDNLNKAIEKLMVLEKKTRQASDLPSTSRILETIITLCHEAKEWALMNENILILSKKHGQLKLAITKMVRLAIKYMYEAPGEPTFDVRLSIIEALRTVTEGKIFVEVERARVTRELSKIKKQQGHLAEAKTVLCELQVETFGSMDRKEKTDIILEQVGLCIEQGDFAQALILSRKISTKWFDADASKQDPEIMELKLRFYEQQVHLSKQDAKYLDTCKHYRAILDTPRIQENPEELQKALERIVYYVILAPYDNEQSDLLHRIRTDTRIQKLIPEQAELLRLFTVIELMPWARVSQRFETLLRATEVFGIDDPKGPARWEDLRKRVIEHNVRVVAKYYTRITMDRLKMLLDLDEDETETYLSKLVCEKTVNAKIDRPARIITFGTSRDADDVLNEWSGNMKSLLGLLERIDHLITKEEMMANIAPKVKSKDVKSKGRKPQTN